MSDLFNSNIIGDVITFSLNVFFKLHENKILMSLNQNLSDVKKYANIDLKQLLNNQELAIKLFGNSYQTVTCRR